jgi:hypothetical protein
MIESYRDMSHVRELTIVMTTEEAVQWHMFQRGEKRNFRQQRQEHSAQQDTTLTYLRECHRLTK